jgi:hypothetical protein
VTCYICGSATPSLRLFPRAADAFTGMMIFLHVSCSWNLAWTEAITCQPAVMRNSAHMTGSASSTGRQHGQAPYPPFQFAGMNGEEEHVKAWRLGPCLLRVLMTSCISLARPPVDCRNLNLRIYTILTSKPRSTRSRRRCSSGADTAAGSSCLLKSKSRVGRSLPVG